MATYFKQAAVDLTFSDSASGTSANVTHSNVFNTGDDMYVITSLVYRAKNSWSSDLGTQVGGGTISGGSGNQAFSITMPTVRQNVSYETATVSGIYYIVPPNTNISVFYVIAYPGSQVWNADVTLKGFKITQVT